MNQSKQEKKEINLNSLKDLAIYLSGLRDGKGNLYPLGNIVLDDLWDSIKYLQGDVRYICSSLETKQKPTL